MIDQIVTNMHLSEKKVKSRDTAAMLSKVLKQKIGPDWHNGSFDYISVIGKLNYLEKGSRPDIAYTVHKCARFTYAPKKDHAQELWKLVQYLKGNQDKGTILNPNTGKDLDIYVDSDFAGNWYQEESLDRDTKRYRHGYIVM